MTKFKMLLFDSVTGGSPFFFANFCDFSQSTETCDMKLNLSIEQYKELFQQKGITSNDFKIVGDRAINLIDIYCEYRKILGTKGDRSEHFDETYYPMGMLSLSLEEYNQIFG